MHVSQRHYNDDLPCWNITIDIPPWLWQTSQRLDIKELFSISPCVHNSKYLTFWWLSCYLLLLCVYLLLYMLNVAGSEEIQYNTVLLKGVPHFLVKFFVEVVWPVKMIFWFHFHKLRYAHIRLSCVSLISMQSFKAVTPIKKAGETMKVW